MFGFDSTSWTLLDTGKECPRQDQTIPRLWTVCQVSPKRPPFYVTIFILRREVLFVIGKYTFDTRGGLMSGYNGVFCSIPCVPVVLPHIYRSTPGGMRAPLGPATRADRNESVKRYRHCIGATHDIETALNIPIVGVYECTFSRGRRRANRCTSP